MPFFIFILFYTLGALLFTFIAISLNKTHKWVTLKELNSPYDGDMVKLILILGIVVWPFSIFAIGVTKCISLFINFFKTHIPKE